MFFIYRYIFRESCSQFDSLPLTYFSVVLGRGDIGALERTIGAVLVDSGTTFSYLGGVAFELLRSALARFCARDPARRCVAPRVDGADEGSVSCFDFSAAPPQSSDEHDAALRSFPNMTIVMRGGETLCITAHQYLFALLPAASSAPVVGRKIKCVGIFRDDSRAVLGVNLMTGFESKFDREGKRLGFARAACGGGGGGGGGAMPYPRCDASERANVARFVWSTSWTMRLRVYFAGRLSRLLVAVLVALALCCVSIQLLVCGCAQERNQCEERCDDLRDCSAALRRSARGRAAVIALPAEDANEDGADDHVEAERRGLLPA